MKPAPLAGLTGMYCAGKNYIAALLQERGFAVLDVDKLGHIALDEEAAAVRERFGEGVFDSGGRVDRPALGARVFRDGEARAALEAIVHPAVNCLTRRWLDEQAGRPAVVNAALLHRSVAFGELDFLILVTAPLLTRLLRARKRDRLPWGEIFRRFRSQRNFNSQYLSLNADIHIVNNRGCFPRFSRFEKKRLESRIDAILSVEGMRK